MSAALHFLLRRAASSSLPMPHSAAGAARVALGPATPGLPGSASTAQAASGTPDAATGASPIAAGVAAGASSLRRALPVLLGGTGTPLAGARERVPADAAPANSAGA
mmetsp:Transcript_108800/g.234281  ORF Transcript_108800/g.234281 Transcript_108800/m.234281 type:complete len:107 (-) Transcript_108800:92-412(-)|eukprot:CAMPEP_0116935686 /NCGR_PEP_ID=MMETSP0467-20121206/30437_1 /TAXON_ID=283647 /ORGANISM="Mesodinium pulex, Strain SPMC105" /LENGTH=106 /DNA_ID=CAMNT_0004617119 /DNA_START=59 /DNA_END=379 /DNA_ORIENTATION=-